MASLVYDKCGFPIYPSGRGCYYPVMFQPNVYELWFLWTILSVLFYKLICDREVRVVWLSAECILLTSCSISRKPKYSCTSGSQLAISCRLCIQVQLLAEVMRCCVWLLSGIVLRCWFGVREVFLGVSPTEVFSKPTKVTPPLLGSRYGQWLWV